MYVPNGYKYQKRGESGSQGTPPTIHLPSFQQPKWRTEFRPITSQTSLHLKTKTPPEGALLLANDQPPIYLSVQTAGSGVGWP
ncbi:hypothetical protein FPSE_04367 [Fusarium pseudograminearum CS3096]|uniref:Uncharacterized protein n=1 Tax=Fusarium pseudograminearum (strain CS3096) TaxID=1028729 RepID=K3VNY0_FUSPC|nr:hypothetical protein FPSE_04367 [Fusarium pseudograminearum CS3096]EKJ75483.1 hypothetical protein FPSE_04367 [Fusarium pseudograminearum CS3096]